MAVFLPCASAAVSVLIECSELGIGRCMTTCLRAVANQRANTEALQLLCLGQGMELFGVFLLPRKHGVREAP